VQRIDSVNEPFYCAGMPLNIHVLVYCGGTMTEEELITILWAIEKASISRGAAIREAYAKGHSEGYAAALGWSAKTRMTE